MDKQIHFNDFNFKLAVIQVLMYKKKLLKPKFDLFEFAKAYKGRKIDIDKEGYDIIPEAKKYFEDLAIPSELLLEIDEIEQDGGNDIHHELIPFWDGEDEVFNITSTEDLILVPNLKKITLLYDDDEKMVKAFREKGIEADYL